MTIEASDVSIAVDGEISDVLLIIAEEEGELKYEISVFTLLVHSAVEVSFLLGVSTLSLIHI